MCNPLVTSVVLLISLIVVVCRVEDRIAEQRWGGWTETSCDARVEERIGWVARLGSVMV